MQDLVSSWGIFARFSSNHLLRSLLGGLILVVSGCLAPSQNFAPHSAAWDKANPEFVDRDSPTQNAFHRVLVGVLDGGLDYNHPRLRRNIHPFPMSSQTGRSYGVGYDVLGEDYFPNFQVLKPETLVDMSGDIALDTQTHGTHVAQLAALGNPSVGLIPVRVLPAVKKPGYQELYDNDYPQFLANVAHQMVDSVTTGIAFAASNGATIINMSIGISIGELRPPDRDALMTRIRNQLVPRMETEWSSVLMVVAASNEGKKMEDSSQMIPATLDLPDILCVGALESSRSLIANYSNWGRYVDVYIRGTDIRSAVPDGGWERMSGTSMAAPLITHLAAELKLIDASLTPRELRALILNTAKVENLPVAPKENSLPSPPAIRMVRVADFLAAKRRARELQAASPEERKVWLTPPYVHGAAPF